ncbi:MAG: hypothetical protein DCF32_08920 [Leptolyngbya sp.]|nr:MAG: hypothetical protein DCF32_08920 [Leptolyngbya sp.]
MNQKNRGFWIGFPLWILLSNLALWGAALTYLTTAERTYTSSWSVLLPDVEENTRITLPDIGQTTSEVRSPFEATDRDPRETYKFIATGTPVRNRAAEILDISASEFGSPRVEIIDNTTLIKFVVSGDSSEIAYQKALALKEAFAGRVEELRIESNQQRRSVIENALRSAQDDLEQAQQELAAYKSSKGLVSGEQLIQLSSNIENLLIERATLVAEQQQAGARLNALSGNLDVSSQEIADAFLLEADEVFRQNLIEYSEATRRVEVLKDQLGSNHPAMVRETARQTSSRDAMVARASELLGYTIDEQSIAQLMLSSEGGSSARGALFQEAFVAQVDNQGLAARLTGLDSQLSGLELRLRNMAKEEATLENLARNVAIAEAVFTSYLTRLNSVNTELFGSYPPIQVVNEPVKATSPSSPKTEFILLGTVLASMLITLALGSLALQQRRIKAQAQEDTHYFDSQSSQESLLR